MTLKAQIDCVVYVKVVCVVYVKKSSLAKLIILCACRSPPGTLKEGLAEQLGLTPKEVTIVVTDVQGSSRLWEW